jgi:acyl-coenzyme A synthetase/AMP-(fatty) acid ligase
MSLPIIQKFVSHASTKPSNRALVFIADNGEETISSYGDLYEDAASIAWELKETNLGQGDVILISMAHSQQLVATLIAAMFIGAVPTILPCELTDQRRTSLVRQFTALVLQAKAAAIITTPERAQFLRKAFEVVAPETQIVSTGHGNRLKMEFNSVECASGSKPAYMHIQAVLLAPGKVH